jgi:glycerol kinase
MQFQADLFGRPVQRLKILELSAFGAGVLAGAASGLMDEAGIEATVNSASEEINPRLDPSARQLKIGVWNAAVNSVIGSAKSSRRHS